MAQHQHILCSSGGSSGGGACSGRSKSNKQKKIPQRGLGVAQLEKIRMEDQRRKLQAIDAINRTFGNSSSAFVSSVIESSGPNLHRFQEEEHCGYAFWPQNSANVSLQIAHVLNSHVEPPSNQSSCGSTYAFVPFPQQTDERSNIIGVKRPYPFQLDNSSYSFTNHVHTVAYSGQPSTSSKDPRMKKARGNPLESNGLPRDQICGDFLTLAPPTAVLPDSRHHHGDEIELNQRQEKQEKECPERGSNRAAIQVMSLSESMNEYGREGEGAIDLDLKL